MAQVTQSIRRLSETGKPVLSALILGRGPTTVMVTNILSADTANFLSNIISGTRNLKSI